MKNAEEELVSRLAEAIRAYSDGTQTDPYALFRLQAELSLKQTAQDDLIAGSCEKLPVILTVRDGYPCVQLGTNGQYSIPTVPDLRPCVLPLYQGYLFPSVQDFLHSGIIGLYNRFRESPETCFYLTAFIELMNDIIDKYKYEACRHMADDPNDHRSKAIYEPLGTIKYLPPARFTDALHALWMWQLIFRTPIDDSKAEQLLQPYLATDTARHLLTRGQAQLMLQEWRRKSAECIN